MFKIRELHVLKIYRLQITYAKKYFAMGWLKDWDYRPCRGYKTEKILFELGDVW